MKKYLANFDHNGVVVVEPDGAGLVAVVEYTEVEDDFHLPLEYRIDNAVTPTDDTRIGKIRSYLPEDNRVDCVYDGNMSTLQYVDDTPHRIQTPKRTFDIAKMDLDQMDQAEAAELERNGFTHGYELLHSLEEAKIQFYDVKATDDDVAKDPRVKKGDIQKRAMIFIDDTDVHAVLPLLIAGRIASDIEGKQPYQAPEPEVEKKIVRREKKEGGGYAQWVRETFPPYMLDDAFPYIDQDGELEEFLEHMEFNIKPMMFNGPTGNGKTVLARHYAYDQGLPFHFDVCNESMRVRKLFGSLTEGPEGVYYSPGSLTLAVIHDGVYVLEEAAHLDPEELPALNLFLETGEAVLYTHMGPEVIRTGPNFRFIVTGNFHANYTAQHWNDAELQRYNQIKFGYPSPEMAKRILQARAEGLSDDDAMKIANITEAMRKGHGNFKGLIRKQIDLGLKGPVTVAQMIAGNSSIPFENLMKTCVINPLTTYENGFENEGGKLKKQLMELVRVLA